MEKIPKSILDSSDIITLLTHTMELVEKEKMNGSSKKELVLKLLI